MTTSPDRGPELANYPISVAIIRPLHMIEHFADRTQAITLGADKAYDTKDFVKDLRSMKVTPHVAQNINGRRSAIDGRTTRHSGYGVCLPL